MLCIFDCETIPDVELIKSYFKIEGEDDFKIIKEAIYQYEKKHNTTFLPIPFHKVVAISAVIADRESLSFKKVNSIDGESEEEMIRNFFIFINRFNPKLISFNGRGFDIPMLMIRALKYSISCPAYFEIENRSIDKNKWENYRVRYSDRFHIDLLDVLTEYGAIRGLKLDLLCQMVGIPGKFDIDGSQVVELFYQNEIKKIKEYCESDVLNTYWLYLKYELLRGNITEIELKRNLKSMAEKLDRDKSYYQVFKSKIDNIN